MTAEGRKVYNESMDNILFEIITPLEAKVFVTRRYWDYIVKIKHPVMQGREKQIKEVLISPEEVRRSRIDEEVFLYYKTIDKLYCVVVKHNDEGFIITCYPTEKIKEGETIWKESL